MAQIQPKLDVSINPAQPVQEVCDVIAAVLVYHQGREVEVLTKLQEAITQHIDTMKGADTSGK